MMFDAFAACLFASWLICCYVSFAYIPRRLRCPLTFDEMCWMPLTQIHNYEHAYISAGPSAPSERTIVVNVPQVFGLLPDTILTCFAQIALHTTQTRPIWRRNVISIAVTTPWRDFLTHCHRMSSAHFDNADRRAKPSYACVAGQ